MTLYGQSILISGIAVMVTVCIIAVLFFAVHLLLSARLKKQLKLEYGEKDSK